MATRIRGAGPALFAALAVLYFAVGVVMVLRYNLFDPDAPSRVANAGYAFMSRDPHLSAIGFVWNPLPSIVEMPFLRLAQWWPALKTHGLAGAAQSALFMAGSATMLRGVALDRGIARGWRLLAVAGYALNPLVVMYGGSGMSEAAEIFCLLWCIRYLLRWVDSQWVGDLAWAAIALGVGYLARYELIPAVLGAAALVVVVAWRRSATGHRWSQTALSLLILSFPIIVAFVVWAVAGWVVAGELFAQFSSRYGNGNQVATALEHAGLVSRSANASWRVIVSQLIATQPFVFLATGVAGAIALLRRRFDPLVPFAVIGPVLLFSIYGQITSTTFGWFRYYVTAIPLVFCAALVCWRPAAEIIGSWRAERLPRRAGAVLLTASVLIAPPMTFLATLDSRIGNQQLQFGIDSILHPEAYHTNELWYRRLNVNERQAAAYLDQERLPDGAVLMDTFNTWAIWLASGRPRQFLITSDYDFTAALNRPWELGVRYIVDANPATSAADAVNIRYPTFWADGGGIAVPTMSIYGPTGEERFRVYEVTRPADEPQRE